MKENKKLIQPSNAKRKCFKARPNSFRKNFEDFEYIIWIFYMIYEKILILIKIKF